MTFVFVWFLFGLASAIVASNKARSGCGWFVLGVALGPFGLLFALLVADRSAPPVVLASASEASPESMLGKICPRCAENVKILAQVCRYCGHEFTEEDDRDAAVDLRESRNKVVKCSSCGCELLTREAIFEGGMYYCREDGLRYRADTSSPGFG
jgi:ribosomal protein L40E